MNKQQIIFISAITFALIINVSMAHEISVSSPAVVKINETFTVNVSLSGDEISGVGFDLRFDNSVLNALSVQEGPFINQCTETISINPYINNSNGIIKSFNDICAQTQGNPIKNVSGIGTASVITFKAISAETSDIILDNVSMFSPPHNLQIENVTIRNGKVSVHECDLNHDGLITHDYNDLMSAYKCFIGVERNCNSINVQDWNLMKSEYNCFTGNFN